MRPIHPNRQKIEKEGKHAVKRGWLGAIHWENFDFLNPVVEFLVKAVGLFDAGYRNADDFQIQRIALPVRGLPPAFAGVRILWLSDFHIERFEHLPQKLIAAIEPLEYDYCIYGGDSCFEHHDCPQVFELMEPIARYLASRSPVFGVLGNHDTWAVAELLDRCGFQMLINDSVCLQRSGQSLYFAGVEDCHYFYADDLALAMAGIPKDAVKILLSHSPEIYKKAAAAGFEACLSGHTHAGQICLPGGIAVINSASIPRKMIHGLWNYNGMTGYTSSGIAASGAPVRFNCRPELSLLALSGG